MAADGGGLDQAATEARDWLVAAGRREDGSADDFYEADSPGALRDELPARGPEPGGRDQDSLGGVLVVH